MAGWRWAQWEEDGCVVETNSDGVTIGESKIANECSKADYPTLPDVGTVFDV